MTGGRTKMKGAIALSLALTISFAAAANDFLPSGNGENWDLAGNWSEAVYPNAPGAHARIGIPTAFKKNKGWRNIHIDSHDIVVGSVEVACGGCTNRIDTGDVGGGLTFDGNGSDASFAMTDASGAGLAMIDLDAPNVVTLASHTTFTVDNAVGCGEFGGIRLSGVWNGKGKNLKKAGPGLMTIDFTNAVGTAFGKLQVEKGVLAILNPIAADSITKSGECRVAVRASAAAEAAEASVTCTGKVSVDNISLFVASVAGGATLYGGVVSPEISPTVCKVYVPDANGPVLFDGGRWSVCEQASVELVDAGDGLKTYAVTVPAAPGPGPAPVSASVSFETTAPALGRPIVAKVNGTGLTDPVFRWTARESDGSYDEVRASTAGEYTPTEADLEHWIRVEVFQDGVRLCENQLYFSRLPVVYLNTDDGFPVTVKEEYKGAGLVIQGNAEFARQYSGRAQVKGRGNSSWLYPQKPLKLKLDKKADLFGFGKNKHWVLLSSFIDVAAVRNEAANSLAKALGIVGMDMTPVTLIYNGDYHGIYELCEHIRVDENRIDIFNWDDEAESVATGLYAAVKETDGLASADEDALIAQMDEDLSWITTGRVAYKDKEYNLADYGLRKEYDLSGGYLFEASLQYDEQSRFMTASRLHIMVDSPEFLGTDPSMMGFVTAFWQRFEDAYSSPSGVNGSGESYADLADPDAMAAYWLVNVVLDNIDACENSRYASLDVGGKLMFGPVWDFDCGSGARHGFGAPEHWSCLLFSISDSEGETGDNFLRTWARLPMFRQRIHELYWERVRPWMTEFLKDGGMLDLQIAYRKEAGLSQDRRWGAEPFTLWGDLPIRTVAQDSAFYRQYMRDRMAWLDAQFATIETLTASLLAVVGPQPQPEPTPEPALFVNPPSEVPFAGVATTYGGWLTDADGHAVGTVTVKVTKPARDGSFKVTATLQPVNGKKRILKGTLSADGNGAVQGDLAGLVLGAEGFAGVLGEFSAVGGRDCAKDKKTPGAEALESFKGRTYALAFAETGVSGFDLVTVKFRANGKASSTVIRPDGTKKTVSGKLVYGDAHCCLPVTGGKKGAEFGMLMWFSRDGALEQVTGTPTGWVEQDKGILSLPGNANLVFRIGTADVQSVVPEVLTESLPSEVPVSANAQAKLKLGVSASENPASLRVTGLTTSGAFTARFSVYEKRDGKTPRKITAKVRGLFVNGVGYGNVNLGASRFCPMMLLPATE